MLAFTLTKAALTVLVATASPVPSTESAPAPATPTLRRVQHEYDLSTFQGDIESSWANIVYDAEQEELFLVAGETISVFKKGLKVFEFATDPEIGNPSWIAPLPNGDLLVASPAGVFRCNFRGRYIERFRLKNAPPGLADFSATTIHRAKGRLYLAAGHNVLVVEEDGTYVTSYDLRALAFGKKDEGKKKKGTADQEFAGFNVDKHGNLLFTSAALAKAYIVSPEGKVQAFGTPGSRNGNFNTPGPIARDDRGILYVADTLRCVVILFDADLQFIAEIGGRGTHRDGLLPPASIAVGNGMLFVSQGAGRGVRAFRVVTD